MDEWQVRLAEMETVVFKTVFCHIRKLAKVQSNYKLLEKRTEHPTTLRV